MLNVFYKSIVLMTALAAVAGCKDKNVKYNYPQKNQKVIGIIPGYDLDTQKPADERKYFNYHMLRDRYVDGFENICGAIRRLAEEFQDVDFVYPVHLNPNVREPVNRILGDHVRRNVKLLEPLGYLPFVKLMMNADVILTDSGGVQEEAPSLGKPVLVMRDTTERPEAVTAGTVKIVGTWADSIYENVKTLLTNRAAYEAMSAAVNPYGDGKAVGRIMEILKD